MSVFTILETLLLGPLKLVFEIIFSIANRAIGHPGLAIIALSLAMNFLVLPLYRRADAMQEAARDTELKLHDGIAHIKKVFSGDEQMMILQTYYRQNNYSPLSALNGSVSLLLEIPFFMAAYQFLSNLEILNGVSLGPITDLGAPDGLLNIGGITLNLLPILMTFVNIVSSAIYLKGFPLKTKIQLYAMALFFLVFLYTSPSCLVFYWTLNNVFSLVKTIFYKLKDPRKVLSILASLAGIAIFVFGAFFYETTFVKRKIFLVGLGILLQIPLILPAITAKLPIRNKKEQPNQKLFLFGSLFLTLLIGLLIPSTYIAASPQEYIDISFFHNPLWYIVSSLCLAAGTFLIWMRVFYWLASDKGKVLFEKLVWILCGVTLTNYMFFGTNLGVISSALKYEGDFLFSSNEYLTNTLAMVVIVVIMYCFTIKWKHAAASILVIAVLSIGGMSLINVNTIKSSVDTYKELMNSQDNESPHFQLSQTGENVMVILLDRAVGAYVPYIFNEFPELEESFSGFTYYENTISYGAFTNFTTPSVYGGYEYTPVELNKRDSESLVSKHNEALKVMPALFAENGYNVTLCDPVYANYQWIPDVSIYEGYPEISTFYTNGAFGNLTYKEQVVELRHRNFFCFSLMKSMPLYLQPTLYNYGRYNEPIDTETTISYTAQTQESLSTATGISAAFADSYNVIVSLPNMTNITAEDTDNFLFLYNGMTHEPAMLQTPDYTLAHTVDNTQYDAEHSDRFTVDGKTLKMETPSQMIHYHANAAALLRLGEYFDYMKENGVYDNTRIIIVSDHANASDHFDNTSVNESSVLYDIEYYHPLLMVKDFNSDTFTTSDEFMTNADVPTFAVSDLIENPVNPFTGKAISNDEKYAHDQYVIISEKWDIAENSGTTFLPDIWAKVNASSDSWDLNNWTFYSEAMVLKEHNFSE